MLLRTAFLKYGPTYLYLFKRTSELKNLTITSLNTHKVFNDLMYLLIHVFIYLLTVYINHKNQSNFNLILFLFVFLATDW